MSDELNLSEHFSYLKDGVPINRTLSSVITVLGDFFIENPQLAALTDTAIGLGGLSSIGHVLITNLATVGAPPSAVISSITQAGTPGTNNYSYLVVANFPDGSRSISEVVSTALGAATLNGTNYNIITWASVTGASSYDVYRTATDGTPSTTGKISTGATSPLHDTGLAGDGSTATEIDSQFEIDFGHTSGTYVLSLYAGEFSRFRWNAAAIHSIAVVIPTKFDIIILPK